MSNKDQEFEIFLDHVKKISEVDKEDDLAEINTNYQRYKIRETNRMRNEIEYFTNQNYKTKSLCFCDKTKTIYLHLVDAIEDAEFYNRVVYVCDPLNKYRIYHTYTKK